MSKYAHVRKGLVYLLLSAKRPLRPLRPIALDRNNPHQSVERIKIIRDILDMGANLIFFLWYGAKKSRVIDTDLNTLIWGHFRIYMFDMGSCFRPFIWYGVLFLPVHLIWGQKSHFIRYGVKWGFFVFRWYGVGIILSFDIGSFLLMEVI